MNNNMTGLISAFVRYYHNKNSNIKIYDDKYAELILKENEIFNISKSMSEGINFFDSSYNGDNPLDWIVNNQLGPSVLARAAFNKHHLINEIKLGLMQYVIMASGYDTSGYLVNNKVKVYELDRPFVIEDKKERITSASIDNSNVYYIGCDFNNEWISALLNSNYNTTYKTFCSLLGISYYLDKKVFNDVISKLSLIIPSGSAIVFDYPNDRESRSEVINKKLAKASNEEMKSIYTYSDIEMIANNSNMLIYENLYNYDIDTTYFYKYNLFNPDNTIKAPSGVSYCLLVKK